ncbi:MAG: hypothetical protein K2Q97_16055 [Burkholderiaceae bacterium]|nr:hypothetical protein [Burkholderiaceae bacterium]
MKAIQSSKDEKGGKIQTFTFMMDATFGVRFVAEHAPTDGPQCEHPAGAHPRNAASAKWRRFNATMVNVGPQGSAARRGDMRRTYRIDRTSFQPMLTRRPIKAVSHRGTRR